MKIILFGYGKMGKTIERLAKAQGDEIVLKVDIDNRENLQPQDLQAGDVVIEFTNPESAFANLKLCLEAGLPVVSGTTGWLDRLAEVKAICQQYQGAMIYASNFSLGVNVFFALNKKLAAIMQQFDQYQVALEEIHHTQKLDAPSGTAITLAEGIIDAYPDKTNWINEGTTNPQLLPITSKRIDQVPGTHTVTYQSVIDQITIQHKAHSRDGFAGGALLAAKWLIGKQGFYTMNDVLGL